MSTNENAAHAVIDVMGNLLAVTLNKHQAIALAKRVGPGYGCRPADAGDMREIAARIEALTFERYDMDSSGCDSCGQDCGADMLPYDDGDYVLWEDVRLYLPGRK